MAYAIPRGVPVAKALHQQRDRFREMLAMYDVSPNLVGIGGGMTPEQIQRQIDGLDRYLATPVMVAEAKALGIITDPEADPQ